MLIVLGDSDGVRLEHAVELFKLLGGGVMGDLAGLPRSQLAMLPGTAHLYTRAAQPPAIAPSMTKGSSPSAIFSGSGASGDSWDRSSSPPKKRTNGRRRWLK